MSALMTGLPDFASAVGGNAGIFAPYGGVGSYAVQPRQLVVATDRAGKPRMKLEIEKSIGDFSAGGRWATFDMTVAGDYPLEAALATVRALTPGATVAPLAIDAGFARLYATSTIVAPPAELLTPVPLGLGGQEGARWTMRLSADAGEILKACLEGNGVAPLGARAEFVSSGVAARTPLAVEFSAKELVAALVSGNTSRVVTQPSLISVLTQPSLTLPLKVIGTVAERVSFGQAMQDRLLSAYASLIAAPGVNDPASFLFADPATVEGAMVHWDLSEAAAGTRGWVILFDPMSSIRAMTDASGVDALVSYIAVPALQDGLWKIDLTTNLPSNRRGVALLGATVEAPARPPLRPVSISSDVTFEEPADEASFELHLAMREPLQFNVTPYVVFADAQAVHQDIGATRALTAAWVQLQQGDFPVRFLFVSADSRVLALADVAVGVSYSFNGRTHQQSVTLTAAAADVAVGLPRGAANVSTSLNATAHDGGAVLPIAPPSGDRIRIDLTSFKEYGAQTATIECAIAAGDAPLFLDLMPESLLVNVGATPAKVLLTSDQPSTSWTYLATSPFQAGFCYRISAGTGTPPGAWSKAVSAQNVLMLAADGSIAMPDANHAAAAVLTS